jgi:hypothetical protein
MSARRLAVMIVFAGAFVLSGCPEDPELRCIVARGPFAATYTLVPGSVQGAGDCQQFVVPGDLLGVEQYFGVTPEKKQDLDRVTLAIQALEMGVKAGERGADPKEHKLYALGSFVSPTPSGNFCTVKTMTPAQLDLAAVPPDAGSAGAGPDAGPGDPALSMKYEWSDVRVLVKPSAPGQAFAANLTLTRDGCTAKYRVNAVYYPAGYPPSHARCTIVDDAGNATGPNNAMCSPKGDPDAGIPSGSGINPDFPVTCHPELLYCVLTTDVEKLE